MTSLPSAKENPPPLDSKPAIQQAVSVKATFNLPDDLYREVKARSALEGKPVREVVISLFRQWLGKPGDITASSSTKWMDYPAPLGHLVPDDVTDHSMEAVRESIAKHFDEDA